MATLFVTFHGGSGPSSINELVAFPEGGGPPYSALGGGPPKLDELRAFLPSQDGGQLFVANGSKTRDQVLLFSSPGAPGQPWQFADVYATAGISHPFDLVFGFGGALFVSNQDSSAVTCYTAASAEPTTFVQGVKDVRGLAFDGTYLYVAESGEGAVRVLDASQRQAATIAVDQPVHLLFDGGRWLYIGSESADGVYVYDTTAPPGTGAVELIHGKETGIEATAGLALRVGASPGTATLYVASRKGKRVLSYPLSGLDATPVWSPPTTTVYLDQLADNPEFIGFPAAVLS